MHISLSQLAPVYKLYQGDWALRVVGLHLIFHKFDIDYCRLPKALVRIVVGTSIRGVIEIHSLLCIRILYDLKIYLIRTIVSLKEDLRCIQNFKKLPSRTELSLHTQQQLTHLLQPLGRIHESRLPLICHDLPTETQKLDQDLQPQIALRYNMAGYSKLGERIACRVITKNIQPWELQIIYYKILNSHF